MSKKNFDEQSGINRRNSLQSEGFPLNENSQSISAFSHPSLTQVRQPEPTNPPPPSAVSTENDFVISNRSQQTTPPAPQPSQEDVDLESSSTTRNKKRLSFWDKNKKDNPSAKSVPDKEPKKKTTPSGGAISTNKTDSGGALSAKSGGAISAKSEGIVSAASSGKMIGNNSSGAVNANSAGAIGVRSGGAVNANSAGAVGVRSGGAVGANSAGAVGVRSGGAVGANSAGAVGVRSGGAVNANSAGAVGVTSGEAIGANSSGAVGANSSGAVGANSSGAVGANSSGAVGANSSGAVGARSGGAVNANSSGAVGARSGGAVNANSAGAVGVKSGGAVNSNSAGAVQQPSTPPPSAQPPPLPPRPNPPADNFPPNDLKMQLGANPEQNPNEEKPPEETTSPPIPETAQDKEWITKFEQFVVKFLTKIFRRVQHERKLKAAVKKTMCKNPYAAFNSLPPEEPAADPGEKEITPQDEEAEEAQIITELNTMLDEISQFSKAISPEYLNIVTPLFGTLVELKNKDFRKTDNREIYRKVDDYQAMINCDGHVCLESVMKRLETLVEFINNIKSDSESLRKFPKIVTKCYSTESKICQEVCEVYSDDQFQTVNIKKMCKLKPKPPERPPWRLTYKTGNECSIGYGAERAMPMQSSACGRVVPAAPPSTSCGIQKTQRGPRNGGCGIASTCGRSAAAGTSFGSKCYSLSCSSACSPTGLSKSCSKCVRPRYYSSYNKILRRRERLGCPCGCCDEEKVPNICGIFFTRFRDIDPENSPLMLQGHSTAEIFPSVTDFANIRTLDIPFQKLFLQQPKCYNPPATKDRCFGGAPKKYPCGGKNACLRDSCKATYDPRSCCRSSSRKRKKKRSNGRGRQAECSTSTSNLNPKSCPVNNEAAAELEQCPGGAEGMTEQQFQGGNQQTTMHGATQTMTPPQRCIQQQQEGVAPMQFIPPMNGQENQQQQQMMQQMAPYQQQPYPPQQQEKQAQTFQPYPYGYQQQYNYPPQPPYPPTRFQQYPPQYPPSYDPPTCRTSERLLSMQQGRLQMQKEKVARLEQQWQQQQQNEQQQNSTNPFYNGQQQEHQAFRMEQDRDPLLQLHEVLRMSTDALANLLAKSTMPSQPSDQQNVDISNKQEDGTKSKAVFTSFIAQMYAAGNISKQDAERMAGIVNSGMAPTGDQQHQHVTIAPLPTSVLRYNPENYPHPHAQTIAAHLQVTQSKSTGVNCTASRVQVMTASQRRVNHCTNVAERGNQVPSRTLVTTTQAYASPSGRNIHHIRSYHGPDGMVTKSVLCISASKPSVHGMPRCGGGSSRQNNRYATPTSACVTRSQPSIPGIAKCDPKSPMRTHSRRSVSSRSRLSRCNNQQPPYTPSCIPFSGSGRQSESSQRQPPYTLGYFPSNGLEGRPSRCSMRSGGPSNRSGRPSSAKRLTCSKSPYGRPSCLPAVPLDNGPYCSPDDPDCPRKDDDPRNNGDPRNDNGFPPPPPPGYDDQLPPPSGYDDKPPGDSGEVPPFSSPKGSPVTSPKRSPSPSPPASGKSGSGTPKSGSSKHTGNHSERTASLSSKSPTPSLPTPSPPTTEDELTEEELVWPEDPPRGPLEKPPSLLPTLPKTKPGKLYKSPFKFKKIKPPEPSCDTQLLDLPDCHPLKTPYPPQYRFDEVRLRRYLEQCNLLKQMCSRSAGEQCWLPPPPPLPPELRDRKPPFPPDPCHPQLFPNAQLGMGCRLGLPTGNCYGAFSNNNNNNRTLTGKKSDTCYLDCGGICPMGLLGENCPQPIPPYVKLKKKKPKPDEVFMFDYITVMREKKTEQETPEKDRCELYKEKLARQQQLEEEQCHKRGKRRRRRKDGCDDVDAPPEVSRLLKRPDVQVVKEQMTEVVRKHGGLDGPERMVTQMEAYFKKTPDGRITAEWKDPSGAGANNNNNNTNNNNVVDQWIQNDVKANLQKNVDYSSRFPDECPNLKTDWEKEFMEFASSCKRPKNKPKPKKQGPLPPPGFIPCPLPATTPLMCRVENSKDMSGNVIQCQAVPFPLSNRNNNIEFGTDGSCVGGHVGGPQSPWNILASQQYPARYLTQEQQQQVIGQIAQVVPPPTVGLQKSTPGYGLPPPLPPRKFEQFGNNKQPVPNGNEKYAPTQPVPGFPQTKSDGKVKNATTNNKKEDDYPYMCEIRYHEPIQGSIYGKIVTRKQPCRLVDSNTVPEGHDPECPVIMETPFFNPSCRQKNSQSETTNENVEK